MFLYAVSAPLWFTDGYIKLGSTANPKARLSGFLTGCPPGCDPSADIRYYGLWETTAATRAALYDLEDVFHNAFYTYRCVRRIPGDSEWFRFPAGTDVFDVVASWIERQLWCCCRVNIEEHKDFVADTDSNPRPGTASILPQNLHFIHDPGHRLSVLATLQQPVIDATRDFLQNPTSVAGIVLAPCGAGKTRMTVAACSAAGIRRVLVLCPSWAIQDQWRTAFVTDGAFADDEVLCIGSGPRATTNTDTIAATWTRTPLCVLTTNASTPLLVGLLDMAPPLDLIIIDEAHHMAGPVTTADGAEGIGRTRVLLSRAVALGLRRLSLTYTPHWMIGDGCLSMDDETVFGPAIAQLRLRDMIRTGVLPDYRLHVIRDTMIRAAGIEGKAALLADAWSARHIVRCRLTGHRRVAPLFHHLVVFTATLQEAADLETWFSVHIHDIDFLTRVEAGDDLTTILVAFAAARRGILINCLVLGEGVDIPCADAVAITYPKQARGQITQMILRAGRWYPKKPVFHVILPVTEDDDLSGFEAVLTTLASEDDQLRDEILYNAEALHAAALTEDVEPAIRRPAIRDPDRPPDCIVMDDAIADPDLLRGLFRRVRESFQWTSTRIQAVCIHRGIDTRAAYLTYKDTADMPWPMDPRPGPTTTWYSFLHPHARPDVDAVDFIRTVLQPQPHLRRAERYITWQAEHGGPSLDYINDGYLGPEWTWTALVAAVVSGTHTVTTPSRRQTRR